MSQLLNYFLNEINQLKHVYMPAVLYITNKKIRISLGEIGSSKTCSKISDVIFYNIYVSYFI